MVNKPSIRPYWTLGGWFTSNEEMDTMLCGGIIQSFIQHMIIIISLEVQDQAKNSLWDDPYKGFPTTKRQSLVFELPGVSFHTMFLLFYSGTSKVPVNHISNILGTSIFYNIIYVSIHPSIHPSIHLNLSHSTSIYPILSLSPHLSQPRFVETYESTNTNLRCPNFPKEVFHALGQPAGKDRPLAKLVKRYTPQKYGLTKPLINNISFP